MRNDEGNALGWHVRPLRGKGAGERLRGLANRQRLYPLLERWAW
jgi:hypothetical protein